MNTQRYCDMVGHWILDTLCMLIYWGESGFQYLTHSCPVLRFWSLFFKINAKHSVTTVSVSSIRRWRKKKPRSAKKNSFIYFVYTTESISIVIRVFSIHKMWLNFCICSSLPQHKLTFGMDHLNMAMLSTNELTLFSTNSTGIKFIPILFQNDKMKPRFNFQ